MIIKDKKIVLIGCTGNLGKPIFEFLKKNNNIIILLSRNYPKFLNKDKKNYFFKMDFKKETEVKDAINFVKKKFKYPDLVVNGAYSREKKISQKDIIKNIKSNAEGYYLINKLFAEYCSVENVAFDFHLKYLRFRRNNKCPQLLLLDWV